MSSLHDFLQVADDLSVRYALLGATAVSTWCPYRVTHDVDAAVDKADLWKLKKGLIPLGYVLVENPRLGKSEFKHRSKGDIDIYTDKVSGIDVSELLRRSVEGKLEGRRVRVVSPEDLIILKRFTAGRLSQAISLCPPAVSPSSNASNRAFGVTPEPHIRRILKSPSDLINRPHRQPCCQSREGSFRQSHHGKVLLINLTVSYKQSSGQTTM